MLNLFEGLDTVKVKQKKSGAGKKGGARKRRKYLDFAFSYQNECVEKTKKTPNNQIVSNGRKAGRGNSKTVDSSGWLSALN